MIRRPTLRWPIGPRRPRSQAHRSRCRPRAPRRPTGLRAEGGVRLAVNPSQRGTRPTAGVATERVCRPATLAAERWSRRSGWPHWRIRRVAGPWFESGAPAERWTRRCSRKRSRPDAAQFWAISLCTSYPRSSRPWAAKTGRMRRLGHAAGGSLKAIRSCGSGSLRTRQVASKCMVGRVSASYRGLTGGPRSRRKPGSQGAVGHAGPTVSVGDRTARNASRRPSGRIADVHTVGRRADERCTE